MYCIFHACSESILTHRVHSYFSFLHSLPLLMDLLTQLFPCSLSSSLPSLILALAGACLLSIHSTGLFTAHRRESRSQPHTHCGSAQARLPLVHLSVQSLKSPVCSLCLLAMFPAHLQQSVLPGATTMALRFPTGCSGLTLLTRAILHSRAGVLSLTAPPPHRPYPLPACPTLSSALRSYSYLLRDSETLP